MTDRVLIFLVHASFLVYRLGVLIFGLAARVSMKRGLAVSFLPAPDRAKIFSGYPIPEHVSVARPQK